MLPHYVGEDVVEEEEEEERDQSQFSYGKCNKCFVEMNQDSYIENKRTCRR